jgi:hypothetical protein
MTERIEQPDLFKYETRDKNDISLESVTGLYISVRNHRDEATRMKPGPDLASISKRFRFGILARSHNNRGQRLVGVRGGGFDQLLDRPRQQLSVIIEPKIKIRVFLCCFLPGQTHPSTPEKVSSSAENAYGGKIPGHGLGRSIIGVVINKIDMEIHPKRQLLGT